MKINYFLKNMLRRTAAVSVLTFASGYFLPALYAEDTVVTYEYTAENWDDSANYNHEQNGNDKHRVTITNVNAPTVDVRGVTSGDAENGADGHYVSVTDSVLKSVWGSHHGHLDSEGRYTGSGNTVVIKNSVVGEVSGSAVMSGYADNNIVILEDSTVNGTVYGGRVMFWGKGASNNQIIIRSVNKKIDLSNTIIKGGISAGVCLNNTLTLEGYQGEIKGIYNVSAITLTLSDWNPDEYVLTVTDGKTNLEGVNVTVNMESIAVDAEALAEGDELKLFSGAKNADKTNLTIGNTKGVKQGISKVYDFDISVDNGVATVQKVTATVERAFLNPQTKALAEGRLAALTLNNRAGDLVAEQGITHAVHAAAAPEEGRGLAAFVALSGTRNKVETGSHVDVDGMATMVGISAAPTKRRAFTLGGFVESGWGQYSSFNSFANADDVRAEGESAYCGGGLLANYAFNTRRTKGLELNASLRAGRQETDFGSADLTDGRGNGAHYDVDSSYIAGHVGMSYTRTLRSKLNATMYARYLWSRVGSANATICGDSVRFNSLESNRLRAGIRTTWMSSERWQSYLGFAYEWECSGTARAMTQGMGIEAPSMRGGSGIGEVGVIWHPNARRPLWVEGALQGSIGRSQGFGAKLGCSVAF